MTSLITNTSSMAALQSLRSVNSNLLDTQQQASTGLRVNSSADNVAYWSISTTMKSDTKAVGAVDDTIGVTQSILSATYTGLSNVIDQITEMKSLVIQASNAPDFTDVDPFTEGYAPFQRDFNDSQIGQISSSLDQLSQQLLNTANSASFNGVNLLTNPKGSDLTSPYQFPTAFTKDGVQMGSLDLRDVTLFNLDMPDGYIDANRDDPLNISGILDDVFDVYTSTNSVGMEATTAEPLVSYVADDTGSSAEPSTMAPNFLYNLEFQLHGDRTTNAVDRTRTYNDLLTGIDNLQKKVITAAATIGAAQNLTDMSSAHLKVITDNNEKGIGRLVDADMEETSSRMTALQTQQQLAVQSLSIANSAPQNILQLFQ